MSAGHYNTIKCYVYSYLVSYVWLPVYILNKKESYLIWFALGITNQWNFMTQYLFISVYIYMVIVCFTLITMHFYYRVKIRKYLTNWKQKVISFFTDQNENYNIFQLLEKNRPYLASYQNWILHAYFIKY